MIKHLVLLRFRKDAPAAEVEACMAGLAALRETIPGMLDYSGGAYSSAENLHRGYTHAFSMTFDSAASRDAYLVHPAHVQIARRVVAALEGGIDGVIAFDYEA
jgi:hypothetical protein